MDEASLINTNPLVKSILHLNSQIFRRKKVNVIYRSWIFGDGEGGGQYAKNIPIQRENLGTSR